MDIIYFKIFRSNKVDYNLVKVIQNYEKKELPLLPLRAITLMTKYNIPEGKNLGNKLKLIEELWVNNNFKISDREVEKIVNN
jgi:poly(A) polymerase